VTRLETLIPIPSLQGADIELPADLERLYDLAYNLWWTWNPQVRQLFSAIDSASWSRYRNPVEVLINVDHTHWESLVDNDTFMEGYSTVKRVFESYMQAEEGTWYQRRFSDRGEECVAYFSMEYGLHQSLAIYSGGLGVLGGDHCKSASDLGIPFVGEGLLYRHGYFRQTIDADGFQQHTYPDYDFNRLPLRPVQGSRGGELIVRIPFPGREVAAKVWVAHVGRVPLLLLDTDLRENDPADRPITNVLYVRGREVRLAQEAVLGVGGARALEELDIQPSVWHLNEGHSALLQLERLRSLMKTQTMVDLATAVETIGKNVAFTTHTPVPAGNEQFEHGLASRHLESWTDDLRTDVDALLDLGKADHGEPHQPLNLTALALRTSSFANGVSHLNAEVSDRMWRHLFPDNPPEQPVVEAITNGVHLPSWIGLQMRTLLEKALGPLWIEDLLEAKAWWPVNDIPDADIWAAHQAQKERLLRFTRSRLRKQYARHGQSPSELRSVAELFDPETLTIGFARRFATYKRANLIFSDLHRLRQLLCNAERPVQIFLAGKAHPADRPGQELIQHIFKLSQQGDLRGRVVFLENYDIRVARMLVQGVDLWLNTPRRPLEASGTSGMKAAVNGVLNFSVLDGWWPEGFDGENGWAVGPDTPTGEDWREDLEDANSLYQTLEETIVPTFYDRDEKGLSAAWVTKMKRSIATIAPRFAAGRMVRDYVERAYAPLFRRQEGEEESVEV
jgi:starch phosphorylase